MLLVFYEKYSFYRCKNYKICKSRVILCETEKSIDENKCTRVLLSFHLFFYHL